MSEDSDGVGFAPSSDIFAMDEDGSIRFADGYKGEGALFTVPLDKTKANTEKAEELLSNTKHLKTKDMEQEEAEEDRVNNTELSEQVEIKAE